MVTTPSIPVSAASAPLSRCIVALLLASGIAAAPDATAQKNVDTPALPHEIRMLPAYCQARMAGNTREAQEHWTRVMGPTYEHIHHYCRGLVHTNRSLVHFTNRADRMRALSYSIGEFDYVIRNAPPTFVLLPEILTKRGENLVRLGRASEGTPNLLRAIELKSDYWPPYAAMSDYHKSRGEQAQARQWLDKALAIAPNAKPLQARLAELGGKQGTAPAPAKPADKAATAPKPETPAATGDESNSR